MLGFYNYTTWLTYLGLLSGVAGIWCALSGHGNVAVFFLALSGFFDLFDGKVAQTKKDRTEEMKEFGIQIDSLSDLVCFCVLPGCILFTVVKNALGAEAEILWFLPVFMAIVLAGLIRLSYFNVSEKKRQQEEGGKVRKVYSGIPVTLTAVAVPFFLAIYKILFMLFGSPEAEQTWQTGYLIFYCAELLFFAFGFLFKGFKVNKVHGKKMLIPLLIGAAAILVVAATFIISSINK